MTMIRLVYRTLTGTNGETVFAMDTRPRRRTGQAAVSKPQRHPDMARLKSEPFAKARRIDARMTGEAELAVVTMPVGSC